MSYLERSKGLPYGGIPYELILTKLEETDLPIDPETNYNNYIRSELVDYSLDKPFLEYDTTRRDSTISKVALNVRYNGTRGTYEYPKHPDMFIGFTDPDPRGVENVPRMSEYRDQINTRLPNVEVRMGYNDDNTDHERPWTNQSLNDCRRDIQTALKYNTKVFTDELDGRALNNNIMSQYDHNKPQLIYKDIIPGGASLENISGKSNNQFTTSSVPFVSHDTKFTNSTTLNTIKSGGLPKGSVNNPITDHYITEEYVCSNKNGDILKIDSKIKNTKTGHVFTDYQEGIMYSSNVPNKPIDSRNIQNDLNFNNISNNDASNIRQFNKYNNIGNRLSDTKINEYKFTDLNVVRKNNYNYNNNNLSNNIQTDIYPYFNEKETNIKKNLGLYGDNNILLINSSVILPDNSFNNNNLGKHTSLATDTKRVTNNYDVSMPMGIETDTHSRKSNYVFSDSVNRSEYEPMKDYSTESINKQNNYQKEYKIINIETDSILPNSEENRIGKSQKQFIQGGTNDTIIDIPNTNDFSIGINGGGIGKKLVRGDYYNSREKTISGYIST